MKIYVAGAMSNLPDHGHPAFHAAADLLRSLGHEVVSPAEQGYPLDKPWAWYLRRDIPLLLECDAVAVLDGWRVSRGARLEVHVARELGLAVLRASTLEPVCDMRPACGCEEVV